MSTNVSNAPDDLLGSMVQEIFKDHNANVPLHHSADGSGFDEELWKTISSNGFETVLGSGDGTLVDAASILRHAGYWAARVPLADAMLAHWLASKCGWEETSAVP